jgi:hypothetical protein
LSAAGSALTVLLKHITSVLGRTSAAVLQHLVRHGVLSTHTVLIKADSRLPTISRCMTNITREH